MNITVTIKNYNGLVDILEYDVLNINEIKIVENNKVVTIYIRDYKLNDTTRSYDITRENAKFLGMSLSPYSIEPDIKSNDDWKVLNINEDVSLYEIYSPTTDYTISSVGLVCYTNKSENNRVDKTKFLTKTSEVVGVIKDGFSIIEPIITVKTDIIPKFNYVHIPTLSRYYYVNDISNISKNMWEIKLSCDVLMSYKSYIYNLTAFVDRNEFTYNPDVINKDIVIKQGYTISDKYIANYLFTGDNASSFVLSGLALRMEAAT